jgi:hypothetical protein
MKRQKPVDLVTLQPRFDDLKSLARSDAPPAKHKDVHEVHPLLCDRIEDLENNMGDEYGGYSNWESLTQTLMCRLVQEEMSGANRCDPESLLGECGACDRGGVCLASILLPRIGQVNISAAAVEEGVQAYRIG